MDGIPVVKKFWSDGLCESKEIVYTQCKKIFFLIDNLFLTILFQGWQAKGLGGARPADNELRGSGSWNYQKLAL